MGEFNEHPHIKMYVLPGGRMPKRMSKGAIGYDAWIRAVVSATEMDPQNPALRKTLFDFKTIPSDPKIARRVVETPNGLVYRLKPGNSALVGIGCITEMPYPLFYWLAPRSGLASKFLITVANAPGTVDPDYRGEAAAIVVNNGKMPFDLTADMRIVQLIFQWAIIPQITEVEEYQQLSNTDRGAGGFGSTGLIDPKKVP